MTNQRRGFSLYNIEKNLTKVWNKGLAPILGAEPLRIYKDARKMNLAKTEKLKNKIYAEGEKIPQELHVLEGVWYGDGSGRTWKEGGKTPCRNRFDGQIKNTPCYDFRKKNKQKFVEGQGFVPRFV